MLRRERRCFLFLVHLLDGGGRKVGGILVSEHAQGDLRRRLLGKQRPSHPLVEEEDQDDKQQNDHHQKEVVRGTERPRTGDGKVAQRPVLDGDLSVALRLRGVEVMRASLAGDHAEVFASHLRDRLQQGEERRGGRREDGGQQHMIFHLLGAVQQTNPVDRSVGSLKESRVANQHEGLCVSEQASLRCCLRNRTEWAWS